MFKLVDLHHLPADYLDTYISKMYAVKPPQVQGMTEKYIDPGKMTIVLWRQEPGRISNRALQTRFLSTRLSSQACRAPQKLAKTQKPQS